MRQLVFELSSKQSINPVRLFLFLVMCIGMISCQKGNTPPASQQNKTNTPDPRDAIIGNYAAIDTIIFWGARINSLYQSYAYVYHMTLSVTKDPSNSTNIILSETTNGDTKTWYGMNVISVPYNGNPETCFNISDQYFTTTKGLKYYILGSTFFVNPSSGGVYDEYFYGKTMTYYVTGNVLNYNYSGKIVDMPYTEEIFIF